MRTTLDLDDELLGAALARFPTGTPKTVVLEEALRHLVRGEPVPAAPARARPRDARMEQLVAERLVRPATATDAPAPVLGGVPLARVLADLDRDREDR